MERRVGRLDRPADSSANRPLLGQIFAGLLQILDFLGDEGGEFPIGVQLGGGVTDPAPRKEVGAVADIGRAVVFPSDESQVLVLRLHVVASRMAFCACFS